MNRVKWNIGTKNKKEEAGRNKEDRKNENTLHKQEKRSDALINNFHLKTHLMRVQLFLI